MDKSILISDLFKASIVQDLFPEKIAVTYNSETTESSVDIIICAYNFPELTNATIDNYLKFEKKTNFNIVVVEGSGDINVYNKIKSGSNIFKVLIKEDIKISEKPGKNSWGMSLSAAVGTYFSKSKYIFYSHSDMAACKNNFLTFLKNQLNNKTRIISFTQRHFIPFTGCMMVDRDVFIPKYSDWACYQENFFIKKNQILKNISDLNVLKNFNWIDSGEAIIYSEILQNNNIIICSSVGSSTDYFFNVWNYFFTTENEINNFKALLPIKYQDVKITKPEFDIKYKKVIKSAEYRFWEKKESERIYWRYSFDNEGEMIFIHHGRGTTTREVKKWLKFMKKLNK